MEIFRRAVSPWGQEILIGVSWELIGVFAGAGLLLILLHMIFASLWAPRLKRRARGGGGTRS